MTFKGNQGFENSPDKNTKEIEQQKFILKETNEIYSKKTEEFEKTYKQMQERLDEQSRRSKELEQEKIIQKEISKSDQKKRQLHRTHSFVIIIVTIFLSSGLFAYMYYENDLLKNNTGNILAKYQSNYIIQDLKGDTVNTWVAWHIADGRILHINIINEAELSQDKIDVIKDAILSTKSISLDDSLLHKGPVGTSSTYYEGWEGAMSAAAVKQTAYYIPQKFDISGTPNGIGDIKIILTNDINPDGLSGLTKSIADGNEILKSKITIYSAGELSTKQLQIIIRHEFGHSMGLAHSTAPEDLMHPIIQSDYPYISECDIDAVKKLYDGGKKSEVVCQK